LVGGPGGPLEVIEVLGGCLHSAISFFKGS
jgi:hypothetical protein